VINKGGTGAKGDIWEEHAKRSVQMFNEANVEIKYYER